MTNPLVSCVLPVYDGQAYLAEAIESVLDQTYRPLELIVVDDGSTDDSAEIARSYGDRLKLLTGDDDGPSASRNRGIRAAEGSLLAFIDYDDRWRPEKLERQVETLRRRPDLGYVLTKVALFFDGVSETEATRLENLDRHRDVPGYSFVTMLARRELFTEVGTLDPERWYTDSIEWFERAEAAGIAHVVLDEELHERRIHGDNLTLRANDRGREEVLDVVVARLRRKRAEDDATRTGTDDR
jgi:glycosyltransferase involved in cell wall biosynthesis